MNSSLSHDPKDSKIIRLPVKARGWENATERAAWRWLVDDTHLSEAEHLALLFTRWRADPVRYANEALRVVLMPYQAQIALDIADAPEEVYLFYGLDPTYPKRQVLAPSGHGLGKTRTTAVITLWHRDLFMFSKTLITAPTSGQLTGQLWGEITTMNLRLKQRWPELASQWNVLSSSVTHKDEDFRKWGVWGRTARADQPEGLQGAHALDEDDKYGDLARIWGEEPDDSPSGGMLVVCEEASGVDDTIREVLTGALSEKGARFLGIGNPTRADGWFARDIDQVNKYAVHELDCRMSDTTKTYSMPYEDFGGNVSQLRIDGFVQPKYWEGILEECDGDENDDYFRRRVAGKKPTSNVDQVIRANWIDSAIRREADPASALDPVVLGLDFGLTSDKHALAVRQSFNIRDLIEWLVPDNPVDQTLSAARTAIDAQKTYKAKFIIGDANGVGRGAMEYLYNYYADRPELGVTVIMFNSGNKALDDTRYFRRRDEMWFKKGRAFFSDPRCCLPDTPGLKSQLTAPGFQEVNRKIKVETKVEIERRTKQKSGNAADAVLQTLMIEPVLELPKEDIPPIHPSVFSEHFKRFNNTQDNDHFIR